MFTLEQVKNAHSKVKSGADFPAYIRELKSLGLSHYSYSVEDGNAIYYGSDEYSVQSGPKYENLLIAGSTDSAVFKERLQLHQQGGTTFLEFCSDCALAGVEKWVVSITEMSCTYFDKQGKVVLVEEIPA